VLKATSTELQDELSSLCAAGGTDLLLKAQSEKHEAYGRSCLDEILFKIIPLLVLMLLMILGVLLVKCIWDIDGPRTPPGDKSRRVSAPGSAILFVSIFSIACAHKMRHVINQKLEQRSERRCMAIESFRSDMQSRLTQLAKRLQPVGFVVSTEERDGNILEVVIAKLFDWKNSNGALPAFTRRTSRRPQNMLSEVDTDSIRSSQYYFIARTPLDVWLIGGLMLYRAQPNKKTCSWKDIIDEMSPISEKRVGYTMKYEIRPGRWPNTTKGTIQFQQEIHFQETIANDVLCPATKQSTDLHITRRTTTRLYNNNAQLLQTV